MNNTDKIVEIFDSHAHQHDVDGSAVIVDSQWQDIAQEINALVSEGEISKSNHCVNCAIEWARQYETDNEIAKRVIEKCRKYASKALGVELLTEDLDMAEVLDWLEQEKKEDIDGKE